MDRKLLKELIERHFSGSLSLQFFEGKNVEYEGNGFFFVREFDMGIQEFSFNINYYGEGFNVYLTNGYISFNAVEKLLSRYYLTFGTYLSSRSPITFIDMFNQISPTRNSNIYTTEDFEKLVPVWKKDIKEKVLPFFDQWSDLKKINDEIINKISRQELPNYIPGETSFKKMIIMKLCNNPDYLSYMSEREHVLFNAKEKDKKKYEPYYNLFMELKAELENTAPLYL